MRASPGPRHRSATAPVPGAPLSIPPKHSRGPPVYKRPARQTEKGARKKKKKKKTHQPCKAASPATQFAPCEIAAPATKSAPDLVKAMRLPRNLYLTSAAPATKYALDLAKALRTFHKFPTCREKRARPCQWAPAPRVAERAPNANYRNTEVSSKLALTNTMHYIDCMHCIHTVNTYMTYIRAHFALHCMTLPALGPGVQHYLPTRRLRAGVTSTQRPKSQCVLSKSCILRLSVLMFACVRAGVISRVKPPHHQSQEKKQLSAPDDVVCMTSRIKNMRHLPMPDRSTLTHQPKARMAMCAAAALLLYLKATERHLPMDRPSCISMIPLCASTNSRKWFLSLVWHSGTLRRILFLWRWICGLKALRAFGW